MGKNKKVDEPTVVNSLAELSEFLASPCVGPQGWHHPGHAAEAYRLACGAG